MATDDEDMASAGGGPSGDNFDVEVGNGFALIRPDGDLDLKSANACRAQIVGLLTEHPTVVVDLDALDYIDSSGLGALMMGYRFATERGRRLALVCTVPRFRRSFELRGVDLAIPIHSSLEEALAHGSDGAAP